MIKRLLLYFHTVRFLKPIQIYYQIYYGILNRINNKTLNLTSKLNIRYRYLTYNVSHPNKSYSSRNTFEFLNIKHQFKQKIDWEYMVYGKLWQYNLVYFNYLNSPSLRREEGLYLINDFISKYQKLKSSNEPYPISLRIINWIRFISHFQIKDHRIIDATYIQVLRLNTRLEYHLMGNHLLENAFCLLHASLFFSNKNFYSTAKKILIEQLDEQILSDGGHFELSPMYHQIIYYRVLESIDVLKNNVGDEKKDLLEFLTERASIMHSWLINMTFKNGEIPLFNDSAFGIALSTIDLRILNKKLHIPVSDPTILSTSGYRRYNKLGYEAIIDVGHMGPSYQPGHAHSDMLSIIVYYNSKPFIVDTGTSTYQINDRRYLERSTNSHNTVTVENQNQSEIWSGFRVAKRARLLIIEETEESISACHDGFKGISHERSVIFQNDKICVSDTLKGREGMGEAHWHFHPDILLELNNNKLFFQGGFVTFDNASEIIIENYFFAPKFNTLILSRKVTVKFRKELTTKINFKTNENIISNILL